MIKKSQQESEIEQMHRKALELCRQQVRRHNFGPLVFLSFVGTRPWLDSTIVDYDYRGVYLSREDNSYQAFISTFWINNYIKDIILISLERFLTEIGNGQIQTYLYLNSPIIYESEEFMMLRHSLNRHPSKQIYKEFQFSYIPQNRKDYLYSFLELGNTLAVLEGKKMIANLSQLNRKFLHISVIDELLEDEHKTENNNQFSFQDKPKYRRARDELINKLRSAYKKSVLPENFDRNKISALGIVKKINPNFWVR